MHAWSPASVGPLIVLWNQSLCQPELSLVFFGGFSCPLFCVGFQILLLTYSFLPYSSKRIGDKIASASSPFISPMNILEFHKHNLFVLLWSVSPFSTMAPLYLHSIFCLCKDLVPSGIFSPSYLPTPFLTHSYQHLKYWFFLFFRKIFFIPYILLNISIPFQFLFSVHLTSEKSCLNLVSLIPHLPITHSFIAVCIWPPIPKENIFRKVTCFTIIYCFMHACTHTYQTLWLGQDIYGLAVILKSLRHFTSRTHVCTWSQR